MICSRSTTASASGGGGSPSASDGFGDAAQDTNGPYQIVSGQPQGITSSVSSGGTSLFKKGSSASVTVATKQFTASASGSVGANDGGLLQAGYSFGAGVVSPPSVGVTAPTNDAIVMAGGDVTVSVHGDPTFLPDDSSNPLQSLSLKITGGTGGGGDLTPDVDGNASLDVGTLPTGMYTATVEAKYTNGSGTVTVDSQPVTFYVADFTVKTNSWNPNPAYVGEPITGQVQGTFDPSSIDGGGSGPFFVTYTWTTEGVWYSQDGTAGSFEPLGSYAVGWTQGQASTTFSAQFFTPGQYLLEVVCTATVYSQATGAAVAVFTQTGYIGGDASDIDTSGGGQAGHARKAHGRIAHAGGGGAGITVVPATVTFSDTSLIKLGLGSPHNITQVITATVTPSSQTNTVRFGPTNGEVSVASNANLTTGVVTLVVTAVSATPVTKSTQGGVPDCYIAATNGGILITLPALGVPVIVYVPKAIGTPHPTYNGSVSAENVAVGLSTTPIALAPPGKLELATIWMHELTIIADDQFGNPLDSIYAGASVQELLSDGMYHDINSPISASGTYKDLVGVVAVATDNSGNILYFSSNDPIVGEWQSYKRPPFIPERTGSIGQTITQNIPVSVGGYSLDPSVNNRMILFNAPPPTLDIEWP